MFLVFSKIYNFLKSSPLVPSLKNKCRVFLAKDLRQYKVDYFNIINYFIGKEWCFGSKKINLNTPFLKFLYYVFIFVRLIIFIFFIYIFFRIFVLSDL